MRIDRRLPWTLFFFTCLSSAGVAQETVAPAKALQPEVQTASWAVKWWLPRHEQKLKELRERETVDLLMIGDAINQRIRKFADNQRVFYLDINHKFLEEDGTLPKSIMPDLLHPNEKGYEVWAEAMEPTLAKLLGEASARAPGSAEKEAERILKSTGVSDGVVSHLGCGDGTLTAALHAGDRFLVHGLDTNAGNVDKARQHSGSNPYSVFPAWNHWPVGQYPSDGRYVRYPDRAAHSSLTRVYWDFSTEFGQQGAFEEKILLEGMSDLPAEELLKLARSFVDPPQLTPRSDGLAGVFDPAERAYKLTRASGDVKRMQFTVRATDQQPLVNPAFVVVNWGDDRPAEILIDGKKPDKSVDVRQGVVRRANGVTSLVVWMGLTRASPLDVEIRKPD